MGEGRAESGLFTEHEQVKEDNFLRCVALFGKQKIKELEDFYRKVII